MCKNIGDFKKQLLDIGETFWKKGIFDFLKFNEFKKIKV
jgi:hypothetical protein